MKTIQYFSEDYIESCRALTTTQIAQFLEDFRELHQDPGKSKLISIKVPERLLRLFKQQSELLGVPYQTQIKQLMQDWLKGK